MANPSTTWQQVQRHQGAIALRETHGAPPQPQAGEARVRILGAGICGADVRVVGGNKIATGDPTAYTTLGHEGTGVIEELGPGETLLRVGDQVVITHHFPSDHATFCAARAVAPKCIGNGHTHHLGWDVAGVFADYHLGPVTHLVRIDPTYLRQAEHDAPHIGTALYAFTEPMLCVLSAYELLDRQLDLLERPRLAGGRALVLGVDPLAFCMPWLCASAGLQCGLLIPRLSGSNRPNGAWMVDPPTAASVILTL